MRPKPPRPKPPILVSHVYPPIPSRQFDWCAYRDGEEERGNYGWGPSPQSAIDDLLTTESDND